ncbi:MAG: hypothetical protein QOF49_1770, partial [Chloroflexota bacterium]|nr:hypothetical protein [Chloroflexota bacterium]
DGGARGLDTGVSTIAGTTWTHPTPIPWSTCAGSTNPRYTRATDPWVSFGPTGIAHQVALSLDPNGFTTAILASRSTNQGAAWSNPAVIIDDNDIRFFNDKESITADPTDPNLVYVTWDRISKPGNSKGTNSQFNSFAFRGTPMVARSTDAGVTWKPAKSIAPTSANIFTIGNQIVVQPDGTLIDFFDYSKGSGIQPSNQHWKAILRSTDHGVSWSKITTIAKVTEAPTVIPDGSFPVRAGGDDIAVDPSNGDLYAVWTDSRFNDGSHNDVVLSRSTDAGRTWSVPAKVSKNPVGVAAFTPSVHVNNESTVAVTYYDFRNPGGTAGPAVATDYWFESSFDHGATWFEGRLTRDASFDITKAPVAPASRGYFLGDYEGLSNGGSVFYTLYVITTSDPGNRTEVFFQPVYPCC